MCDVKSLKGKIRPEDAGKTSSPWNIAADFDVDMSFSQKNIAGIAALLYAYTSGYPFLVSRLCKLMDEKVVGSENLSTKWEAWTKEGFLAAVRMLLTEDVRGEPDQRNLTACPGRKKSVHQGQETGCGSGASEIRILLYGAIR